MLAVGDGTLGIGEWLFILSFITVVTRTGRMRNFARGQRSDGRQGRPSLHGRVALECAMGPFDSRGELRNGRMFSISTSGAERNVAVLGRTVCLLRLILGGIHRPSPWR